MGVILMIVAAIGGVLSLLVPVFGDAGWRRHRTVVDDGRADVVRREDTHL